MAKLLLLTASLPPFPSSHSKKVKRGGLRLSPIVVSISSSGFSSSSSSSSFPSAGSTSSHTSLSSLSSLRQIKEPPLGREEEEATSDFSSPLPSPRDKSPLSPACVRVCSFLPLRDNSFPGKKTWLRLLRFRRSSISFFLVPFTIKGVCASFNV